jgi:hypothetical protein
LDAPILQLEQNLLVSHWLEPLLEPNATLWPFPFTEQDWQQTPPAVQAYLHTLHYEMGQLHEQVENLEARLNQDYIPSLRPPSSDSLYKKPRRCTASSTRTRKGGGKPGHPGHRQVLLAPTTVEEVMPTWCACGSGKLGKLAVYSPYRGFVIRDGEKKLQFRFIRILRRSIPCKWHVLLPLLFRIFSMKLSLLYAATALHVWNSRNSLLPQPHSHPAYPTEGRPGVLFSNTGGLDFQKQT